MACCAKREGCSTFRQALCHCVPTAIKWESVTARRKHKSLTETAARIYLGKENIVSKVCKMLLNVCLLPCFLLVNADLVVHWGRVAGSVRDVLDGCAPGRFSPQIQDGCSLWKLLHMHLAVQLLLFFVLQVTWAPSLANHQTNHTAGANRRFWQVQSERSCWHHLIQLTGCSNEKWRWDTFMCSSYIIYTSVWAVALSISRVANSIRF